MDTIKKGTVFKNNWAGTETYFMYQHASGRYAVGIGVYKDPKHDGWTHKQGCKYYLSDLKNDREHFPVVGIAPVKEMEELQLQMLDAVIEGDAAERLLTIQDLRSYVMEQYQDAIHWDDDRMQGMALAYEDVLEKLEKLEERLPQIQQDKKSFYEIKGDSKNIITYDPERSRLINKFFFSSMDKKQQQSREDSERDQE